MPLRSPVSSDDTVTTVVMPMTMPRMVSSERKRCVHTAVSAMLHVLAEVICMASYSARSAATGSSLAARDAGYQPETMPTALETTSASTT